MEFRDLKTQYQEHKMDIDSAISKVLENTNFISGTQVLELEEKLAEYVGVKHCVSCGNGTDALQLALMTWNIGKGDAVFVPDFTFFASGEVVPLVGATPVFVDVCEDTFNIDPDKLQEAIKYVREKTNLIPKVVVAVDLFGQPADFDRICKIAKDNDMYVLEDAAQGFGGSIRGKKACGFGDIATTSFFPAKPLGCYGDGGAIFTDNDEWAELLKSYRVHGKGTDKYDNIRIGINSRLDTVQAVVLLEKLKFFDEEIKLCNRIAQEYNKKLKGVVKVPTVMEGAYSSWAQYTICFESNEQREKAIRILRENGIPAMVYYSKPLHLQKAFSKGMGIDTRCLEARKISDICLSLPMSAYVEKKDIDVICDIIRELIEEGYND